MVNIATKCFDQILSHICPGPSRDALKASIISRLQLQSKDNSLSGKEKQNKEFDYEEFYVQIIDMLFDMLKKVKECVHREMRTTNNHCKKS